MQLRQSSTVSCQLAKFTTALSSITTQASATTPTTAPVSGKNACAQARFSPQQFTGDWTEPGGTTITTLGADGTLKSRGGNDNESGTWSYEPWELTPGKSQMPAGEANHCVLWLHWALPGPRWTWFMYHSKSAAHHFNSATLAAATRLPGCARILILNRWPPRTRAQARRESGLSRSPLSCGHPSHSTGSS
jgi:hypothetical protein